MALPAAAPLPCAPSPCPGHVSRATRPAGSCAWAPPLRARCGGGAVHSARAGAGAGAGGRGRVAEAVPEGREAVAGVAEEEEEEEEGAELQVEVEAVGPNCRRVSASIVVRTPLEAVWAVLTDYAHLADFIPNLDASELLERRPNGARLLQVGLQNLAFGLKFRARVVVDVDEEPLLELPRGPQREILFNMVEGDFKLFKGTWQMRQDGWEALGAEGGVSTVLSYSVEVMPQRWLPVAIVEGIVTKEIRANLLSVRKQAEGCHSSQDGRNSKPAR